MMKNLILIALVTIVQLIISITNANAINRNNIEIVGSSTVYPFATVVAEHFSNNSDFSTPKIESTGSGGGIKLFCAGIGVQYPDITNSSRRIKRSEFKKCRNNGVTDILEVKVGYDGIVVANARDAEYMNLTRQNIFLALAKDVPNPEQTNEIIPNPYKTWQDINPMLPAIEIKVLGPPPTSGTRDAFVELAMEGGCKTFDFIKKMKREDKNKYKAICHGIREDGAYIESGENDNLIVQKLRKDPDTLGIFGYSFLDQNIDKVQGLLIDGIAPTFESIADGSYLISRPLYFYVKKAHIGFIPGIDNYLAEFASEEAWGDEGYLTDKGLIPMSVKERKFFSKIALELIPMILK